MERSDRWLQWNVNAPDPLTLTEVENPPAEQDSSSQQAQDACFEPDLEEAYLSSTPQQAQPDCVELDPAEACPSSPPAEQAQPDCLEPDLEEAYHSSPAEQAQPGCVEVDPAEESPSSTPQQAQPDCFELDPIGAPTASPPPSSTPQPDPTGAPPPSTVLHPPPVLVDQSRFKSLSLLDCDEELPSAYDSPGGHGADNSDARKSGEGDVVRQHSSNDDSDDDEDPFLTDRFGNLTTWRLSDMEAAFEKHLEDEASKPKVTKKYSKEEILKQSDDRKKKFMEYALHKYNNEEDLAGEMRFVFDEIKKEVYIVEGGRDFYEHFNFTAKQAGSPVLFFAEVVPNRDTCDVLCCKRLDCNDNGHCFGCKNQGAANLRHPADEALYVGGHEDCPFPFMWDSISDSEGESD